MTHLKMNDKTTQMFVEDLILLGPGLQSVYQSSFFYFLLNQSENTSVLISCPNSSALSIPRDKSMDCDLSEEHSVSSDPVS